MAVTRRKLIQVSAASAATLSMPGLARSQTIAARQYHSQPQESHLQIYLTKIWDAVREEMRGRLSVTVHPRNNGASVGDPEILTQLAADKLKARGMIFTTVDTESFRKSLTNAGFYNRWRESCGEKAWA